MEIWGHSVRMVWVVFVSKTLVALELLIRYSLIFNDL